jgi:hypothetical protein
VAQQLAAGRPRQPDLADHRVTVRDVEELGAVSRLVHHLLDLLPRHLGSQEARSGPEAGHPVDNGGHPLGDLVGRYVVELEHVAMLAAPGGRGQHRLGSRA